MLETRAIIVQTNGKSAVVITNQANGCEQCNGKGCGAGKLSRLLCSKPRQFKVKNGINAEVGDEVIVSVAEGAVLYGIGWVYMLPLLLLLAGALLGNAGATRPEQGDSYAAFGAALGLAAGFMVARWITLRQDRGRYQPYIARLWHEL